MKILQNLRAMTSKNSQNFQKWETVYENDFFMKNEKVRDYVLKFFRMKNFTKKRKIQFLRKTRKNWILCIILA